MILYNSGPCQYLKDEHWHIKIKAKNYSKMSEIDESLNKGWAVFGRLALKPECTLCNACKPYRVKVDKFKLSKSFKRVIKKCKEIEIVVKDLCYYEDCLNLFAKHADWRNSTRSWNKEDFSRENFEDNFVHGPKGLKQVHFYLKSKLVCVNYLVITKTTCYSMYTYYDPDCLEYSLGTLAILNGIQMCKNMNFEHLHMGFYVEGCQSLSYKDRYKPGETYDFKTKKWSDHEQ